MNNVDTPNNAIMALSLAATDVNQRMDRALWGIMMQMIYVARKRGFNSTLTTGNNIAVGKVATYSDGDTSSAICAVIAMGKLGLVAAKCTEAIDGGIKSATVKIEASLTSPQSLKRGGDTHIVDGPDSLLMKGLLASASKKCPPDVLQRLGEVLHVASIKLTGDKRYAGLTCFYEEDNGDMVTFPSIVVLPEQELPTIVVVLVIDEKLVHFAYTRYADGSEIRIEEYNQP